MPHVKCYFGVLARCLIMCRDQAADHGYDPLLQSTVAADWTRGKSRLHPLHALFGKSSILEHLRWLE